MSGRTSRQDYVSYVVLKYSTEQHPVSSGELKLNFDFSLYPRNVVENVRGSLLRMRRRWKRKVRPIHSVLARLVGAFHIWAE